MQNFDKYLESLDEGKIVLKRRYTENHPEKNVRKGANIRNTIIEALRDKKLTLSEFNEIVAQHSKSPNKWTQRNKRFFTIKEDNVTLSKYGNKIARTLQPVNEGREKPFRKVKVGDVGQDYNGEDVTIVAVGKLGKLMKYDDTGMAEDGLSQGYLDKNDDAVAVESPEGGYALFTYGDDGVVVNESLTNTSDILDRVADIDDILMNTKNRRAKKDWEEYTEDLFADYKDEAGEEVTWDDMEMDDHLTSIDVGEDIMNRYKIKESVVNEGKKVEPGKYSGLYYDTAEKVFKRERIKVGWALIDRWLEKAHEEGHLEYTAAYVKDAEKDIRAAIDKIGKKNMKMFAYESVEINERAKATEMLKHVVKGLTTDVEGIKLSKEMAQAYLDWLQTSSYGRRYDGLPFEMIFKASFNWGIDRYTKNLKGEYKELKQQAKAMKESTIYTDFSNFVNESYLGEEVSVELNEMKEPKCSNKEGHLYKKIDKDGTVECIHCGLRNSLSESVEINEAFKSSKLRNLLNMKKSPKSLMKGIYGATRIALDKVEDHQIVDIDPKQGPKQDGYVFYYTTQEKENPHAVDDYYNAKFPANTLLALAKGKKVFYVRSDWSRGKGSTYSLTTDPKGGFGRSSSATDIGPNKSYSGYDASGLGSLARVISIADAAFVINPDALETTHDKIEQRSQAKEGAIAFKDPKEFKAANLQRYKEILTQRSKSLDVDKEVIKAIEEVAEIMKDGVKNQKKNKWNELIMGTGKDGRDFKINDLTNFTSNLMSDYERWSRYMKEIEELKDAMESGDNDRAQYTIKWNEKEALTYSKSIKDRLRKLKNRNLAW